MLYTARAIFDFSTVSVGKTPMGGFSDAICCLKKREKITLSIFGKPQLTFNIWKKCTLYIRTFSFC